jgi:hypothetical protein
MVTVSGDGELTVKVLLEEAARNSGPNTYLELFLSLSLSHPPGRKTRKPPEA